MRILFSLLIVGVVVGMEIEPVVEGVDVVSPAFPPFPFSASKKKKRRADHVQVWSGVGHPPRVANVDPVAFPRAQGFFDLWTALTPRDEPLPVPAYPRVGQNEATVARDRSSLREMIDKSPWVGKSMQEVGESSAQGTSRQVGRLSKQGMRSKKKGCLGCFG